MPNQTDIKAFIEANIGVNQYELVEYLTMNDDYLLEQKTLHNYCFYSAKLSSGLFKGNIDEHISRVTEFEDQIEVLQNECNKAMGIPPRQSKAVKNLLRQIRLAQKDLKILNRAAYTPRKVTGWLLVTPFLYSRLLRRGEALAHAHKLHWWGRESNLPIEEDPVLYSIYREATKG